MIREALKILAALLENCASAINERLDPPLPMVSREFIEEREEFLRAFHALAGEMEAGFVIRILDPEGQELWAANDETITRH